MLRYVLKVPNVVLNSRMKYCSFNKQNQIQKLKQHVRNFTRNEQVQVKNGLSKGISRPAKLIGRGIVAGAAVLGLGSLCFYGSTIRRNSTILDRIGIWPDVIRDRIKTTYAYFGASACITASSAYLLYQNPKYLAVFSKNSLPTMLVSMAVIVASSIVVRAIPYTDDMMIPKNLAWITHCAIMGAFISPLAFLGGPLIRKALVYTGSVVGSLSLLAVTAPDKKFLNMGGPLAIGLGLVFASSLGSLILPMGSILAAPLYSISTYGGLILFSGFLLYDTQHIVRRAETYSTYEDTYDPVNESLRIYTDALNIFIRIAMILAGSNSKRK